MENIIKEWMLNTIKNGSWKNYNDLHINLVNDDYGKKTNWISGSINCLNMAVKIRKQYGINFIVGIGLSLYSTAIPKGLSFNSIETLENEIDWSPPSLYIFHPNWTDWLEIEKKGLCVNSFHFGIYEEKKYLCEYYHKADSEYRRSLFIVSKDSQQKT